MDCDTNFNATPAGEEGPVRIRLRQFGRIQGFAFGSWGEASTDAKKFVNLLAESGATKIWRTMEKARTMEEVKGVIKCRLRRILGIAAVRTAHQLKLNRLAHITGDFQRAQSRSHRARKAFSDYRAEYEAHFGARTWRCPR